MDPYSATAAGEAWTVQSWLPAAVFAALERIGGADAIRLGFVVQIVALAAGVWALAARATSLVGRVAAAGLALLVGSVGWSERPLLVGLLALVGTLLAIDRRWPAWVLVPVYWVWANSHGSTLLGLLVVAVLLAGSALDRRELPRDEGRYLVAAAAGLVLAAVSPVGPRLLLFPLELVRRRDVFLHIQEWQAPDFTETWERAFAVQLVVAIFAVARRPSYRAAMTTAFAAVIALVAVRNIVVASLILVPVVAGGLGDVGSLRAGARLAIGRAACGVLAAAAILLTAAGLQRPAYDLSAYPIDALAWVRDGELDGSLLVAPDFVGNLLTAVDGQGAAVFIDDRYDMYPRPVIDDYLELLRAGPRWDRALDRHSADVVLWRADQPLAQVLRSDDRWRPVFGADGWVVYCRRGSDGCGATPPVS